MNLKNWLSTVSTALILMFVLRLSTLGTPALIDTTDARYAQIAMNMAIDNNWIVPFVHQEGEMMGYWSKPPLAFWVQAGSLELFGLNEWAARFPGFLWLALTVAITAWFAQRWLGPRNAGLVAVLTAATSMMFVIASMTMTDQPLVAALTGAMIGFGMFFDTLNRWWARLAFFCLGLALLSKGPIGLVLPAASIGAFVIINNDWKKLLRFPWLSGLAIMLCVAAPWYWWMEQMQPGFLKYFLIDENFNRLFSGNLSLRHGTVHSSFRGFGLICFIIVTLPWVLFLPHLIHTAGWRALMPGKAADVQRCRELYLICWFAAPLIPFAIGEQVLPYYLLPLAPGFVLWFVLVSERVQVLNPNSLIFTASITTIATSVVLAAMGSVFLNQQRSTKPIMEAAAKIIEDEHATIAFAGRIPDSAYFYQASLPYNFRYVQGAIQDLNKNPSVKWVIARRVDMKRNPLNGYTERVHLRKWALYEREDSKDGG